MFRAITLLLDSNPSFEDYFIDLIEMLDLFVILCFESRDFCMYREIIMLCF